jgi:protein disulfide-isomerase A1
VDATKEESLGTKYEVQSFPTLKFFTDGETIVYSGGRDAEQIVQWVKKMSGSPTETVRGVSGVSLLCFC